MSSDLPRLVSLAWSSRRLWGCKCSRRSCARSCSDKSRFQTLVKDLSTCPGSDDSARQSARLSVQLPCNRPGLSAHAYRLAPVFCGYRTCCQPISTAMRERPCRPALFIVVSSWDHWVRPRLAQVLSFLWAPHCQVLCTCTACFLSWNT